MKATGFHIINNTSQVKTLCKALIHDDYFAKTFDGKVKNNEIAGFYSNLAQANTLVIGFIKVEGSYNLEKGNLELKLTISRLFLFLLLFAGTVAGTLAILGVTKSYDYLFGAALFGVVAGIWLFIVMKNADF